MPASSITGGSGSGAYAPHNAGIGPPLVAIK
jgi:hypothetical protein